MSKVFKYMKSYTPIMLVILVLLFIEAYSALILPGLMADVLNNGVIPGNMSAIWDAGTAMLMWTVVAVICAIIVGYLSSIITTGVGTKLRSAVFKKVLGFSNAEIDSFAVSSLITRTTNDIENVQTTMMMAIRLLIYSPIVAVIGIIRVLDRSAEMAWIIPVIILSMMVVLAAIFIRVLPKFEMVQGLIDKVNSVARENLSGVLSIRAFSTQKFEKERFSKVNVELAKTNMFIETKMAVMMPALLLILNIGTLAIMWFGAIEVSNYRIEIGDIMAFLQYAMLVVFAFVMIAIMFISLPSGIVSANRIKEVLDTDSSIHFKENPIKLPKDFKGNIEFRNVCFKYAGKEEDNENILNNISFTAKPGETTAIIGSSGSGKSTIFQLLMRFYDVTSGGIYLDGIDIRELGKKDLYNQMGYISQKALLFGGSIRSNLKYGKKAATDEELKEAAETAQAEAFIQSNPDGYNRKISQGGSNLSGGQRQRLSIARALVKKTKIYLFDDSFSALDLKTDAMLRGALKRKMSKNTKLIIAQRVSSIMDAEQIIVIDKGEILGIGTHQELMKTCSVYIDIAKSQGVI